MIDLQKSFPDAHIMIGTVACFGGGLREASRLAKKSPDVFLESKPETTNRAGETWAHDIASTYHELFLLDYMLNINPNATYGEARVYADEKTQEYSKGNPECIIDGELFVETDWDEQIQEAFL